MNFLPLGYHTFADSLTDWERVTYDPDSIGRRHRRALLQARRRHR